MFPFRNLDEIMRRSVPFHDNHWKKVSDEGKDLVNFKRIEDEVVKIYHGGPVWNVETVCDDVIIGCRLVIFR